MKSGEREHVMTIDEAVSQACESAQLPDEKKV